MTLKMREAIRKDSLVTQMFFGERWVERLGRAILVKRLVIFGELQEVRILRARTKLVIMGREQSI